MGIINDIESGALDSQLQEIAEALKFRREVLGRRKHREFEIGDVVTFVNLGMGAKYMNGETAVIVDINPKTLWVRLTAESKSRLSGTRFGRTSRIKVYPSNIELAFLNGIAGEARPKLKNIDDLFPTRVKNVSPTEIE